MDKRRERELKKRMRQLKQRRTLVLVGESTGVAVEQLDAEIEAIREELGIAEDRAIVNEYDLPTTYYIGLEHTIEEYNELKQRGVSDFDIAFDWGFTSREIKSWAKRKEKEQMAKLTIERYKELASKGLKASEIANEVGITTAAVYTYKSQWKKAGLLDDVEKKKEVVAEAKAIVVESSNNYEQLYKETLEKLSVANNKVNEVESINNTLDNQLAYFKVQNEKLEKKLKDSVEMPFLELQHQVSGYKTALQHARDEIEKMGAELREVKEVESKLRGELEELAQELANAGYEYAEIKRDYNMLVTIAKPFVEQFAKELAVKE